MTYPISDVTRRVVYSGSLGAGPYQFTFEILTQADVGVYKNTTLLTLTTDYTVTINADGTGSITLVSAATASDTISIFGNKGIQRQTDFTTGGDLFANSLNDELDAQTIFAQQNSEAISRSVRAPLTDPTTVDMVLPAKADRADKILQFDVDGNPDVVSTTEFVSSLSNSIVGANYVTNNATGDGTTTAFTVSTASGSKTNIDIYIDGVYQNKSTFSVSGTTVTFTEAPPLNSSIEFMIGYALLSAAGSGSIDFTQAGTGAVTRTVESKLQDVVSVKDFGAVGDGVTDDTVAIQAAINAASGRTLFFPNGNVYLSEKISLISNLTISGYGATIKLKDNTNDTMLEGASIQNVKVLGLTLNGNKANQTILGPLIGLYFQDCTDVTVRDCEVYDVYGIGMGHNCVHYFVSTKNIVHDCADNGFDFNGDFYTVPRTNQGLLDVHVSHNTSYNNGVDGIFFGHGRANNCVIHGNICSSNAGEGLHLGEASSSLAVGVDWKNNTISDNICSGNGGSGLVLWTGQDNTITGNRLTDNVFAGIRLSQINAAQTGCLRNVVQGNSCRNLTGSQQYGILLESNAASNVIATNYFSGNTTSDLSTVNTNVIYANTIGGKKQEQTGTITTASIASGGVDISSVTFSPAYSIAPDILLTVLDTTGTEKIITHAASISASGFSVRTVNLDASLAGTATIQWQAINGY